MSMETDSPVVYHGTSESRFPNPKPDPQKLPTGLTAEEKDILRQCNKESLYYRCLPFMLTGMAATHLAARRGFITPHPIWGTSLTMTGAAFVGWIMGKFAYQSKCEEKFLHLENSPLADAVRRKRGYVFERNQNEFSKTSQDDITLRDDPSFSYYPDSDFHSSTGSLNLDVDKNIQYSGLDDLGRPTTDRDSVQFSENNAPVRKYTSYDELRQRNREEYERSQRPLSSRLDLGTRNNNVDSLPPRRYNSDFGEGDMRRRDGDVYDNVTRRQDGDVYDNVRRRQDGDVYDNVMRRNNDNTWDNTKLL